MNEVHHPSIHSSAHPSSQHMSVRLSILFCQGLKPKIMEVAVRLALMAWALLGWSQAAKSAPSLSVAVILGETRGVPERALRPAPGIGTPLDISVLAVQVNHTDPGSMLTHLCQLMARQRLHGLVYGDGTDHESIAQMLDFVSSQTAMPILGVHGGAAMTMAEKVSCSVTLVLAGKSFLLSILLLKF